MKIKTVFVVSDCAEKVAILLTLMIKNLRKGFNGTDSVKLKYLMLLLGTEDLEYQRQKKLICRLW